MSPFQKIVKNCHPNSSLNKYLLLLMMINIDNKMKWIRNISYISKVACFYLIFFKKKERSYFKVIKQIMLLMVCKKTLIFKSISGFK